MRINIVKNASRNIVFSIMKKMYMIILSFVMRTVMIYMLGIEYAGLNGLFTSILNMLNLAELGLGTAIVFSMYKPIAENAHQEICELLQEYKRCYKVIGLVILGLGLTLLPFLDRLISGEIPKDINIYVLYLLNLFTTVCSYFFFSYKSSLFTAFQRSDVVSKVDILINTIKSTAQILVLFLMRNYYLFLIVGLGSVLLKNLLVYRLSGKVFPEYVPQGSLDSERRKSIFTHVKALFLSKVGGVVVNSVDSLVISAVLGITVLGVYQNYYYILSSVSSVIVTLYFSCIAGIGNKLVLEGKNKTYESFEHLSFGLLWICGICCSCFLGLFQPFIRIWVGEAMLLEYGMVILFCVFFYTFQMMGLCGAYEDAAGIWHYDRFRPLLEALLNLVLNLILVQIIGLYGILLSTIISMALFSWPWLLVNLFRRVFQRSMILYLGKLAKWFLGVAASNVAVLLLCKNQQLDTIGAFGARIGMCILVPCMFLFLLFGRSENVKWLKNLLLRMLHRERD